MTLTLNGAEKRNLRDALVNAFPSWNELRRLTNDQLDLNLAEAAAQGSPIVDNAFDLIEWMNSRGRGLELIIAARNQNPGNPMVEDLAAKIGVSASNLTASALQKIVGPNDTYLDVAKWRAGLTRAEWRVCRIDYSGHGVGTGFLVGPNLVLTNYHVVQALIEKKTSAAQWTCRFDYKVKESGETIASGKAVAFAKEWEVDSAPYSQFDTTEDSKTDPAEGELDFALVKLAKAIGESSPGKKDDAEPRGWFAISKDTIDFTAHRVIAILQHPLTNPMKLSLGTEENPQLAGKGRRVRYKVPTDNGSSGSPVFDSDWNVIALHNSGDPRTEHPTYNQAIPISLIAGRPKVAAALEA